MNRAREQLLAGAALAQDQDGRRKARHATDEVDDFVHGAAGPDDELALRGVGGLR